MPLATHLPQHTVDGTIARHMHRHSPPASTHPVHTCHVRRRADLFLVFDQLVERHHVYKVETIGDCYMVCGGLVEEDAEGFRSVTEAVDPLHAHKVFAFAVDMLAAARSICMPGSGGEPVALRVGIHSGPCMSGIGERAAGLRT